MFENKLSVALGLAVSLLAASSAGAGTSPAALQRPAMISPLAPASVALDVTAAGARLVAVGERGHILLSDDHGASWRQVAVPVSTTLTTVRFATPRVGWAAGHGGVILRTADGGESWTVVMDGNRAAEALLREAERSGDAGAVDGARRLVKDGPDKPFLALLVIDERTVLAFGAYGLALRTDDGGSTWQGWATRLQNPDGWHINAAAAAGGRVFLAGEQGTLLRSSDGGMTFSATPSPYEGSFFGVIARSAEEVVVFGLRGRAFASADGGETWRACPLPVEETVTSGFALSARRLVLTTNGGRVMVGAADCGRFTATDVARMGAIAASAPAGNGQVVVAGAGGLAIVDPVR